MTVPLHAAGLPPPEADLDRRRTRLRGHADERAAAVLVRLLNLPPHLEPAALLVAHEILDDVLPYALARSELFGPVTPLARRLDRAMNAVGRERHRVAVLALENTELRRQIERGANL